MGLRSPIFFEQFSRSHFTVNMFQIVTNLKLRSFILILNLSFGINMSHLCLLRYQKKLENFRKFISQKRHIGTFI